MGKNGLDNINFEAYKAGVQEAKDIVDKAIKADKDIISQIKLVQEQTHIRIVFPKGIVPLKMYFEDENELSADYYYFDYMRESIVYSDNNLTTVSISVLDDCIVLEAQFTNPVVTELLYINITNIDTIPDTLNFNSYYWFNPVTSVGTKLYKHDIYKASAQDDPSIIYLTIINNKQEPYTTVQSMNFTNSFYYIVFASSSAVTVPEIKLHLANRAPYLKISGLDSTGSFTEVNLLTFGQEFTDTVTEL